MASLLDFEFKDKALRDQALTHKSVPGPHNERLEFLGDAVLGMVMAELLFLSSDSLAEGELTVRRAAMVREGTLAELANQMGLAQHLNWGRREQQAPREQQGRILAAALEALIGALFLERGYAWVRLELEKLFQPWISGEIPKQFDFKSELQIKVQRLLTITPTYEVIEKTGAAHEPWFRVRLSWGQDHGYIGEGSSRKRAEEDAAKKAWIDILEKEKL